MLQPRQIPPEILNALSLLSVDQSPVRFAWAPRHGEKNEALFIRRAAWLASINCDQSFRFRLWDALPLRVRARLEASVTVTSNVPH
jgi:hypothetical protein